MDKMRLFLMTVARFCISVFFLVGAVKNILYWHEAESRLMSVFLDWQTYVDFSHEMLLFFSMLISWAPWIHAVVTAVMLIGGLLVLIGVKERIGTVLLIIFLVCNALLYHPFWWIDGVMREVETMLFFKDLALVGALISLLMGSGFPLVVDERDRVQEFF